MRIKITKSLVLNAQIHNTETIPEALFPEGEYLANPTPDGKIEVINTRSIKALFPEGDYLANLTPDGKIEVINTRKIKALFSFSQFRDRISLGEFIVLEY